MKLSDVAEVVRWNSSLDLSGADKHIVFELSATKGRVAFLDNKDIYERHAVLILKNQKIAFMLFNFLEMSMDRIRKKYLETMNFKIDDVKNIELNDYFAQF